MITTVIFDLGEVYLNGIKGIERHLENILGIPVNEIYPKINGKELRDLFLGKITENLFWKKVIKRNGWKITAKDLKIAIRKNFSEVEGTREIIEKLKNLGYKLGLLSVHAKEWIDHLEKLYDFHKLFDSKVYSFEIKIGKPDERAYLAILKKLKAKPQECLFIDDHERNIVVAEKLKINSILFKNPNQLKKDLLKFNIAID